MNELRILIGSHLKINEDVATFQKHVDEVNLEFSSNLEKKYPALTPKDIVLCGLLRLNLQNKEIASIRNTSDDAVKMARYRLRKKLGLSEEEDIGAFLRTT